jgi:hypothetical protein
VRLKRQLGKNFLVFTSDESDEQVKNDLNILFSKKSFDLTSDLTGGFTKENEFWIAKKFPFVIGKDYGLNRTRFRGQIINVNGKTTIEGILKPHPAFYLFVLLFPVAGFILSFSILIRSEETRTELILIALLFTFVFPLAGTFYAKVAKEDLKKKFIKYLRLKETTT